MWGRAFFIRERMKELVAYLASSLVTHPDEVSVTERVQDNGTLLELEVAPEDVTHVIGKQGRTVRAMRALLSAAGAKKGGRYFLKILSGQENISSEKTSEKTSENAPENSEDAAL